MITKEYFQKKATFNIENEAFSLTIHSKIFNKEVAILIPFDRDKKEGINEKTLDKIIEIINDVSNLDASNLKTIQKTAWKAFNRYGEFVSYTLYKDDEKYENGQISREEYTQLNKNRQQELYEVFNEQDCFNSLGEPEYRTCLFPEIWNHRFGMITFYPEWEENGLNILVRNSNIIGYASGDNPIIKEFDNPKLQSVYELW